MKGALGFIGVFLSFLFGECVVSPLQLQMPVSALHMWRNLWATKDMALIFTRMYFFDKWLNESVPGTADLKIWIKETLTLFLF